MGRQESTFRVLGIDPSGHFKEGAGTTGWCLLLAEDYGRTVKLLETGELFSGHFQSPEDYWLDHFRLIDSKRSADELPFHVSMEHYVLYANKAKAQINSEMETSQLIGAIRCHCAKEYINLALRPASMVKDRWSDHILARKGIDVTVMSNHMKDAIRHAVHFASFGK